MAWVGLDSGLGWLEIAWFMAWVGLAWLGLAFSREVGLGWLTVSQPKPKTVKPSQA